MQDHQISGQSKTHGHPQSETTDRRVTDSFTPRQLRALKIAVAVMSAVLVVGFAVVAARIVYLVAKSGTEPPRVTAELAREARLGLPAGAIVRSLALSGDRLAVHFDAPAGAGIAILDLATGERVSQIEIAPD